MKATKTNATIIQMNKELKEIGELPIESFRDDPNLRELMLLRINEFHDICEKYDINPTLEGLALALGTDRKTLTGWYQKEAIWVTEANVHDIIAQEWQFLNACHVTGMQEGRIDKIVGIFYGKNNFGYTNEDPEPRKQEININLSASQLIEEAKNLRIKGQ